MLPRADRVFFTVTKISPECALVGRFSVHGKAGLNRIRFAGRVGKRTLDAGTYRISARTGAGRVVQRVLLVVVDGSAPTSGELAAARASNECLSTARTTSSTAGGASSNTSGASFATPKGLRGAFSPGGDSAGSPAAPGSEFPTGGVLASAVEETARALQPAPIVLLAAAIVLLAVASLPRVAVAGDRVNDTLARHRLEIAAVGAAALVAFAITLFLT